MSGAITDIKSIFGHALELSSAAERAAYLDQACGGDPKLRAELESLLQAQQAAGGFLDASPSPTAPTIDHPAEQLGTRIGPYKLLQQIGEGGFGIVYLAEQTEPVRRQVALKLIKPGMDSRSVLARFEAERQALALMDHPHIAKVLDAGTTDSGRPYFVMELVKGVPITKYCDEHRLTPKQRLELFISVCQAVQHAHQKAIIHRDLKPSNVLVAEYDDKPVVKVIDFGVAKATGSRLTERTMFTELGQIVGTLEYMSPEQAKLNALDIDTRSDIYALGVLLYELLTGTTPLEKKRFRQAAFDEMLRIIREEEPPKPSTRLSTTEELPSIAANRGLEPKKLSGLIRGDLDWVVMTCLEKDRNRRYETANGLAMDVQRYLADEPVSVGPPSATYRLRKFARRNKAPLSTALLISVAMAIAVVVLAISNVRIKEEKRLKENALQTAEQQRVRAEHNLEEALRAVDQLLTRVAEDRVAQLPHMESVRRALLEDALAFYLRFLRENSADPAVRLQTGSAYRRAGEIQRLLGAHARAKESLHHSTAILEALSAELPEDHESARELGNAYFSLGKLFEEIGPPKETEKAHYSAFVIREKLATEKPEQPDYQFDLSRSYNALALVWKRSGRLPKAEKSYRQAIAIAQHLTDDFKDNATYRKNLGGYCSNLGTMLGKTEKLEEAEKLYRKAVSENERVAAQSLNDPDQKVTLALAYQNLATHFLVTGRLDDAEKTNLKALDLLSKLVGDFPSRPDYRRRLADLTSNLGMVYYTMERVKDAEKCWEESRKVGEKLVEDYRHVARYRSDLGADQSNVAVALLKNGKLERASHLLREAIRWQEAALKIEKDNPEYRVFLGHHLLNLAIVLYQLNSPEAEPILGRAVEVYKKLNDQFPDHTEYRSALGDALNTLANLRLGRGEFDEAVRLLREATDCQQRAFDDNPRSPIYLASLHRHYTRLSAALSQMAQKRRLADIEKLYESISADLEQFVLQHPTVDKFQCDLGALLHNWSLICEGQEPDKARLLLERAVRHQQAALSINPNNQDALVFLRNHYSVLLEVCLRLKLGDQAGQVYREMILVVEKLAPLGQKNAGFHSELGAFLHNLALRLPPEESDKARRLLELAVPRQQAALKIEPNNVTYLTYLRNHYLELAPLCRDSRRIDDAEHAFRETIPVLEKLVKLEPNDPSHRAVLAVTLTNLGVLLSMEKHDHAQARGFVEKAIFHQESALKLKPKDVGFRAALLSEYRNLSGSLFELKLYGEAEKACTHALETWKGFTKEEWEGHIKQWPDAQKDLDDVKKMLANIEELKSKRKDQ